MLCLSSFRAAVLSLVATGFSSPAWAIEFTVATNGSDHNPGTAEAPFATPARAQQAVRERVAAGLTEGVIVTLRGGSYRVAQPLVFGTGDGGTAEHAVIWKSADGEQAVLSGGRPITGWRAGHDGFWRAQIPPELAGTWRFRELFVNGTRRPRARYPNDGYLRVKAAGPDRRTSLTTDPNAFPPLSPTAQIELVFLHDWSISRTPVAHGDYATGAITLAAPIGASAPQFAIDNYEPHPRFFLENDPVFLDAPGEWLIHDDTWVLYRPLEGEAIESVEFVAPVANAIVLVRGDNASGTPVRNLHFVALTFEHAAWPRPEGGYAGIQAGFYESRGDNHKGMTAAPTAVAFVNVEGCSVTDCIVQHVGASGIAFGERCRHCLLARTVVRDVSLDGVHVGEGTSRAVNGQPWWKAAPEQVATGNIVEECLVERCGAQFYGGVGIWAGITAGTIIRNNLVRELPYSGISIGWRWDEVPSPARQNRLERNHIHDVMQTLSDGGGIYTLGRQPESVIAGNIIHSIPAAAGRAESNGMFLDEGTSGFTIEGNTIYATGQPSLRFHRAGENFVRGNRFVLPAGVPAIRYGSTPQSKVRLEGNDSIPADRFAPPDATQLQVGPSPAVLSQLLQRAK